jgi:hypothetical protein
MTEDEKLRLDYEQTNQTYRMLTDIRFRLLALIPIFSGAGVALLAANGKPEIMFAGGLLGGAASFGVILYDLRNTHLYDAMQQRLRVLEALIGFHETRPYVEAKVGGNNLRRPSRRFRFFGIRVAHDYGLGVIYSAVLSGWSWLVANGLLGLLRKPPSVIPSAVAVIVFVVAGLHYFFIDRGMGKMRELPTAIRDMTNFKEKPTP